ncbi:MAG TPA: hypothetical protein PK585_14380, partial [Amphiplicatus sp.]|nr:hypothetical protein [Amphiplicatus sp.]
DLSFFEKKLSFFDEKGLASFFDKCISIFNKTAERTAARRKPARPNANWRDGRAAPERKKERQG